MLPNTLLEIPRVLCKLISQQLMKFGLSDVWIWLPAVFVAPGKTRRTDVPLVEVALASCALSTPQFCNVFTPVQVVASLPALVPPWISAPHSVAESAIGSPARRVPDIAVCRNPNTCASPLSDH